MQIIKFINVFCLITFFVFADLKSKFYVRNIILKDHDTLRINEFINLVSVNNSGVAFGMLKNMPEIWILSMVIAILLFLLIILCKNLNNNFIFWSISFIISGALGNLFDRLLFGNVFDFIDLHIGSWHWPAFNLADSCISIAAVILFVYLLVKNDEKNLIT